MTAKNIVNILVIIPNLPVILTVAIYVLIRIYKNTRIVEMEFIEDGQFLNHDIKKHIKEIYPKSFRIFVAITFYVYVALNIFHS